MATTTLNPVDTYIASGNATGNFYDAVNIFIGETNAGTNVRRTLMKFDLTTIPSTATITSATLRLCPNQDLSSNTRTMRAYRLKRAWVETEVTWNVYSTGNNWQTAGGFGANDCEQTDIGTLSVANNITLDVYIEMSLTVSAIQEIINGTFTNNGFLLKMDTENNDSYRYYSTNNGSNMPELVVVYTTGGRTFQAVFIG